jgi:hypothetical protein
MWDGTPRINRIFTTNYDNLLALGFDGAQTITETNVRRMREVINNGKLAVIHLHGRIDEHEPYQITESDVLNEKHRILTNELRAALITADAFVFVGYSMNDPDFRRLYQLYRADIENRHLAGKRTYVVMPAASATEFRFGSVLWASRDAVWIPMSATAFFERLKSFLEGYAEDLVREEISTKYGLKTRAALDNLISSTADILNVESADAVQFLLEARPRAGA